MVRFIPKQFAENSTTSVVFGSHQEQGGKVGDGTISSDPATLQGGTAWPLGWKAATDNFFQIPRGEEIEGLERVLSAAIIQQFKDGITFWQSEMPVTQYQTIVQYQTGSDIPKLYINITGLSTSTPPDSDTTNWKEWKLGGGASLPLLLPMWSDHTLNDVSYLRADTFSWHSGSVYSAAYQYIMAEYNNPTGTAKTETIGSQTISYRESPNGLKICLPDQQNALLVAYDEVGVTWFYVLDEANEQFKLPRTKYGFTGFRNTAGGYVPESLPNLTGNPMVVPQNDRVPTGVFARSDITIVSWGGSGTTAKALDFDASRSSSAYKDGAPVQQKATQMFLYFYVGNYTQSAVEQTAGLNAELFNGKADVDLSNVSANIDYIVASGTSEDGLISYALTKKGLLVHWGRYNSKNGDTTITFMHPYADTNYVVTFAFENTTSTGAIYIESLAANTKTETSFTNRDAGVFARSFIAIGKGATE